MSSASHSVPRATLTPSSMPCSSSSSTAPKPRPSHIVYMSPSPTTVDPPSTAPSHELHSIDGNRKRTNERKSGRGGELVLLVGEEVVNSFDPLAELGSDGEARLDPLRELTLHLALTIAHICQHDHRIVLGMADGAPYPPCQGERGERRARRER